MTLTNALTALVRACSALVRLLSDDYYNAYDNAYDNSWSSIGGYSVSGNDHLFLFLFG
jgi:hypothetical protein